MKFQYIGGGADAPQSTTAFGHKFEINGDPVDVTDPAVIAKLSGNQCFAIVAEEVPEAAAEESPEASSEQTVLEEVPPEEQVPVVTVYAKPRKPYKSFR